MARVDTDRDGRVRTQVCSSTVPADIRLRRPEVHGKFLYVGDEKLWVCGVTYGAFRPNKDGDEYHNLEVIERDFAQMAASGLNTVRIPHTMPPRTLLDAAQRHGLRVMVGLSAEQYVGFLIDKKGAPDIVIFEIDEYTGVAFTKILYSSLD